MPSTRSSAATKCISEVPGLVKQTSTPPATKVRTRLSAPFIASPLLLTFLGLSAYPSDQPLFGRFVKGLADIAAIARGMLSFLTAGLENAAVTGSLLAQAFPLWPVCVQRLSLTCEEENDPGVRLAVCGGDLAGGRPRAGARC